MTQTTSPFARLWQAAEPLTAILAQESYMERSPDLVLLGFPQGIDAFSVHGEYGPAARTEQEKLDALLFVQGGAVLVDTETHEYSWIRDYGAFRPRHTEYGRTASCMTFLAYDKATGEVEVDIASPNYPGTGNEEYRANYRAWLERHPIDIAAARYINQAEDGVALEQEFASEP